MRKKLRKRMIAMMMTLVLLSSLVPMMAAAEPEGSDTGHDSSLIAAPAVKPSVGGALQIVEIDGEKTLADQSGNPIQLRGMSTHGLQWFPEIINENAYAALANDWGANVIRLAMYVGENGYGTPANQEKIRQRVLDGIDLAIANDLYVIVDWHVHAPGDPRADIYSGAMDFFRDISSLYPNNEHIIYELANEPSPNNTDGPGIPNDESGWQAIKEYAEPIVEMLRQGDAQNNIIIVGTPNWSQRPDLAADDPIQADNIMYTVHFYTGTHMPAADSSDRSNIMSNARYALEQGVPIFVTEWGTSQASGDGGPYLQEADQWLSFLNENNISWVNWSLTNKNETSAAFMPLELGKQPATALDPGEDQVWSIPELTVSGEYVRARIKGIAYEPIDRNKYSQVLWDFEDGTTQGFGVNGDSPNRESIALSNVGDALQITGLNVSTDTSEDNYWANIRLSADGWGKTANILGAEQLTMDVIVDEKTTVSIAAIPQGPSSGWANPERAVQVNKDDFEPYGSNKYKAVLSITTEDSPSFKTIAESAENNVMNNLILFVGAKDTDIISLDNITVTGTKVELPVIHAPKGTAALPSDFEDGTRQGWDWNPESAVKSPLTIEEAQGSQALSWELAYPDVKPSDGWASAARLDLYKDGLIRGNHDYVMFDLYLKPERASVGAMAINLIFQPPAAGYWQQAPASYNIEFDQLAGAAVTDSVYHYPVSLNMREIDGITDDTELRNMILIFADVDSDFAGRMYIDNVKFTDGSDVVIPTVPGGLEAKAGDGSVELSWEAAAEAQYYNVKRGVQSAGPYTTVAAHLQTTRYKDTGLSNGTTYYYVVSAGNEAGESANSVERQATPYNSNNGGSGNNGNSGSSSGNSSGGSNSGNISPEGSGSEIIVLPGPDQDGKIAVEIAKEAEEAIIAANATGITDKTVIELKSEDFVLQLPGTVYKQLQALLTEEQLKNGTITVQFSQMTEGDRALLLDRINGREEVDVRTAGAILNFSLSISAGKDYPVLKPDRFVQPLIMTLNVDTGVNKDLIGLYLITSDGHIKYIGGTTQDGKLIADLITNGVYGPLSYDLSFSDVAGTHWATPVLKLLAAKHIIEGTGAAQFAPEKSITRAEFAAMIARSLRLEATGDAEVTFTDVAASDWYAEAIAAVSELGIVNGRSASSFEPGATITREEMAVILVRAYEYSRGQVASAGAAGAFADQASVSSWAQEAVAEAHALGFMTGRANGQFAPQSKATRAEAAQVVARLING
ncbi:carbohydrate-binding domain-containing protein [Paenibacillus sp. GM2]|uniref:carbohydrate-binding domain-containing protein n=1 Tax=Paenibacillus sp. GM2 TaxID=1622070 RepID=UPI000840B3CD|nr:carbohydrate-binding domain-containing protein [Paenibacillus sp. GM2]